MANVNDVALMFIDYAQKKAECECGDLMTNLRLQKLLFIAQGCCLARFNRPLFDEPIEAWQFGPVVPCVYEKYAPNGRAGLTVTSEVDSTVFTPDEYELLLEVLVEYDKYSTSWLSDATSAFGSPWTSVERNETISTESIAEYFSKLDTLNLSNVEYFSPKRTLYVPHM